MRNNIFPSERVTEPTTKLSKYNKKEKSNAESGPGALLKNISENFCGNFQPIWNEMFKDLIISYAYDDPQGSKNRRLSPVNVINPIVSEIISLAKSSPRSISVLFSIERSEKKEPEEDEEGDTIDSLQDKVNDVMSEITKNYYDSILRALRNYITAGLGILVLGEDMTMINVNPLHAIFDHTNIETTSVFQGAFFLIEEEITIRNLYTRFSKYISKLDALDKSIFEKQTDFITHYGSQFNTARASDFQYKNKLGTVKLTTLYSNPFKKKTRDGIPSIEKEIHYFVNDECFLTVPSTSTILIICSYAKDNLSAFPSLVKPFRSQIDYINSLQNSLVRDAQNAVRSKTFMLADIMSDKKNIDLKKIQDEDLIRIDRKSIDGGAQDQNIQNLIYTTPSIDVNTTIQGMIFGTIEYIRSSFGLMNAREEVRDRSGIQTALKLSAKYKGLSYIYSHIDKCLLSMGDLVFRHLLRMGEDEIRKYVGADTDPAIFLGKVRLLAQYVNFDIVESNSSENLYQRRLNDIQSIIAITGEPLKISMKALSEYLNLDPFLIKELSKTQNQSPPVNPAELEIYSKNFERSQKHKIEKQKIELEMLKNKIDYLTKKQNTKQ